MSPDPPAGASRGIRSSAIDGGSLLLDGIRSVLEGAEVGADLRSAVRSPSGASALVDQALHHGVAGALHVALADVDAVVEEVRRPLVEAYHVGVRSHLLALDGLRLIAAALDGVTPWLVMKGPVLSELIYSRADLRGYGDLDILVSPRRFGAALDALDARGCVVADRNWDLLCRRQPGELHVLLPSGMWVDLHWHLRNSPSLRNAFPVDIERLMEDGRDVDLSGMAVRTLGITDTFVHLALHACLSGGDRLLWAADLHEAARRDQPLWDEVIATARRQRAALAVGVMLRRADRALPLGVPGTVFDQLSPRPGWATFTGLIDRAAPLERSSGRPSASRIVLRATRATARLSAEELVRRSTRWVGGGARRAQRALDLDPSSRTSFLHDAGGPGARAAYLDIVAASGEASDGSEGDDGQRPDGLSASW